MDWRQLWAPPGGPALGASVLALSPRMLILPSVTCSSHSLLEGVYVYSIGPHDFVPITVEAVERVGKEAVRLRRSPRQQREVVQSSMGPSLKRSASYMA
ncbi:hypothetical protein BHE74_00017928 [Ensete ventricosum]|nr:hypothetical protein BHE74_00017928 [Ensete ventricosum]